MYQAIILADSISADVRLTTLAVTLPRIVLAEMNTHRMFSRGTASSRAIPVKTRCEMIEANPFVPSVFGKNQKGMQADTTLDPEANHEAEMIWREALRDDLRHARRLAEIGVHKQYANRLTEAFAWVTQIITATEWANFYALRCHKDAQPEIQLAAALMREAREKSTPRSLNVGEWHLPFVGDDELHVDRGGLDRIQLAIRSSVARCAAVSYEKHSVQKTLEDEIVRHDNMLSFGHMSPFEHQAKVADPNEILKYGSFRWVPNDMGGTFVADTIGNLKAPWLQHRKTLPGEQIFGSVPR